MIGLQKERVHGIDERVLFMFSNVSPFQKHTPLRQNWKFVKQGMDDLNLRKVTLMEIVRTVTDQYAVYCCAHQCTVILIIDIQSCDMPFTFA